ncbi:hypothetical protein [Propionivibrio dicarboxylicus]|uniref:Uncharacterized protein n=1 Tax=Propionivibrio dicarboxylicus TaxID=83767 RepID=A0A1G8L9K3_9RHOO|nr:hypothetical protein [Propionivibrio dicarboxylicus]SDI52424.1 hypothetical protein SAMN05660652_03581 [Propionivibrio dicarboxylicus]
MSNPEITANSLVGRVLIALRAGQMTSGELGDRFPCLPSLGGLAKKGLISGDPHGWRLTDAGRAACPLRNPLAASVPQPPAATPHRVASVGAISEPVRRPALPINEVKHMPVKGKKSSAVDTVRTLLTVTPEGVSRKDLIRTTSLSESQVDAAIFNLIHLGEATRKSYGVICATEHFKPVEAISPTVGTTQATVQRVTPRTPEVAEHIEFSIRDDGHLSIIRQAETLVLSPNDTQRLARFLGCFEATPS